MTIAFNKQPAAVDAADETKSVRVNMKVPAALYVQLTDKSVKTGLSVPMLLRVAAVEYLAKK
ncbi:hypothetical protein [Paraburkholderia xenovorans]|uniref:hypothetical protein n=1 Tax=Paraburkholderia xenovorans TaxID=36873 RepID=UPI0015C54079|nr:hypothetical protein [Paraburkholderia xenovorans]NPT33453.1 hypothetical protein [Paraburkholderia xenovorans]